MNVADLLRDSAEDFPSKPALVFRGRPITYRDLDDRVDRTAAALARLGVGPGDRVALLAGNVPEFVSTTEPVLGSRTIIIWLPGVWPTQRLTTTLPSPKRSMSPSSWTILNLLAIASPGLLRNGMMSLLTVLVSISCMTTV